MGANISMDVSGECVGSESMNAGTALSFEDKLRQEVVLVPEDLSDIHIQATDAADAADAASASASAGSSSVAGRRNPRRKKRGAQVANANTVPPFQTERTIEQRREQVRPIIDRLTELQMNVSYPAIRELYKQLSQFIKTGEDAKIKIPFPEFSRKIKGELSNAPYIPCWVKLEME
jgi:hypothetical protein